MTSEGKCVEHDIAIFPMLYLIFLNLWFHKHFKFNFLGQSCWSKTMYAEHWRKLAWASFFWKSSYTFSTTYLWRTYEQLLT